MHQVQGRSKVWCQESSTGSAHAVTHGLVTYWACAWKTSDKELLNQTKRREGARTQRGDQHGVTEVS